MPRVEGGVTAAGVRVPGTYAALLAAERSRSGNPDPRYTLIEPSERPLLEDQVEHRSALLRRLLGDEPVVVPRWRIVSAPRDVLMFVDRTVRWFQVTADDVVSPAPAPHVSKR